MVIYARKSRSLSSFFSYSIRYLINTMNFSKIRGHDIYIYIYLAIKASKNWNNHLFRHHHIYIYRLAIRFEKILKMYYQLAFVQLLLLSAIGAAASTPRLLVISLDGKWGFIEIRLKQTVFVQDFVMITWINMNYQHWMNSVIRVFARIMACGQHSPQWRSRITYRLQQVLFCSKNKHFQLCFVWFKSRHVPRRSWRDT